MPIQNEIYYESQVGGMCRLHSLNGYFGKEKISTEEFNKYQQEYDDEYKKKFNFNSSCKNFDIVASDQKNIINYVLKKYDIYTRYYAINQLYLSSSKNNISNPIQTHILNILDGDYFFIYNEGHVWGCRIHSGVWYKVDSLGGVCIMNINTLANKKNIGFIIPVNIQQEFYINLNLIKSILGKNNTKILLQEYLIQKNKEKRILGNLEIPIGICMDILETNLLKKNVDTFFPIQCQVIKYNEFLLQFTKGKYNDIDLILNYIPSVLLKLLALKS
jgi:hypothetical protein